MQVHAGVGLHCCGFGLQELCWVGSLWGNVAVHNLEVEVDVRVLWDVAISNWSLNFGRSPNLVGWAMDLGLGAWMELLDCKFPALEHISGPDIESFWETLGVLSSRISDHSSILELTSPMDSSPLPGIACITFGISFLNNINSKIGILESGVIILIIFSIWTENIWKSLNVYGLDQVQEKSER